MQLLAEKQEGKWDQKEQQAEITGHAYAYVKEANK